MGNKNCKLCGGGYDFRHFILKERLGKMEIVIPGNLGDVTEQDKFRFCPACGEKLTQENFCWNEN